MYWINKNINKIEYGLGNDRIIFYICNGFSHQDTPLHTNICNLYN